MKQKLDHVITIQPAGEGWLVKHEGRDESHHFTDGHAMVAHVATRSGAWPDFTAEEEAEEPPDKPVEEMSLGEYREAFDRGKARQERAAKRFRRGRDRSA